jgi:anti-sigma factor RsiW
MRTMHLDLEQLQRLVDGELSPAAERPAREHLAACAECRGREAEIARQEAELGALLRQVDHAAPRVDVQTLVARARRGRFGWMRSAAVVVLGLGLAGAAYAARSPLQKWAHAVAVWLRGEARPSEASLAGIAVAPGQDLIILFASTQSEGSARVSLTDSADVVVRAPVGAATFASEADRLVIDNKDSRASFEIRIPRGAPRVEIRVAGARRFLKVGPAVTEPPVVQLTP